MTDETENDDGEQIRSEVRAELALSRARQQVFEAGEYELDDWEGFQCNECRWRGLFAPMRNVSEIDLDTDDPFCVCPECGEIGPETSDDATKWWRVVEKISASDTPIDFDVNDTDDE